MNGWRVGLLSIVGFCASTLPVFGQGYTYIAPSLYPAPPVVVYDPALLVPAPDVIYPLPLTPAQPVVPYGPVWSYPAVVSAPVQYRERVRGTRFGPGYTYRAFVPGRAAPVYTFRSNSTPYGVRVRERYR